ncbi:MAG: DUF4276 family protein [Polyangiaceae bacterium]|nr:DUF4276 family protein [Polyangiaceae bacterium]
MKSIAIFVEGGGATANSGQDSLREGFEALLKPQKEAARKKRLRWQLGLYGSRNQTFKAFRNAVLNGRVDEAVLLVDSEEPVSNNTPSGRLAHLKARDGWDFESIDASRVHLMTQCMEAWIVADPDKLEEFYGQGFKKNALPKRQILDEEAKASLYSSLDAATKGTKKGSYGKVTHASEILKRLRPSLVAARCVSFQQLTQWLDAAIGGA